MNHTVMHIDVPLHCGCRLRHSAMFEGEPHEEGVQSLRQILGYWAFVRSHQHSCALVSADNSAGRDPAVPPPAPEGTAHYEQYAKFCTAPESVVFSDGSPPAPDSSPQPPELLE